MSSLHLVPAAVKAAVLGLATLLVLAFAAPILSVGAAIVA